jgi:ribulose-phosphate 3-epimerase
MKYSIAPSIPAQSFVEVEALLTSLRGVAPEIQIDIVDGVFAPQASWPFTDDEGVSALSRLSPHAPYFAFEIDCMCMNPEQYLDIFAAIIVHAGSTDNYKACILHGEQHGYAVGLALLNSTPWEYVEATLPHFAFVQVMGIEHIGVQGQPFDVRTLATIRRLRSEFPHLDIAVDGAVNEHTIPDLLAAGANRFAPGSAITRAENQSVSYKQLSHMVGLT